MDQYEAAIDQNLISVAKQLELLELDNDRITHQQSMLEEVLRKNENSDVLPEYLKLVNEKNSLVRKQMQLNLKEKEYTLDKRQSLTKKELQKLSNIPDERKTEANRQKEQELLDELLGLVNEKNELVLHLDNEEKAMVDDETIEESVSRPSKVTSAPGAKEECVLQ